MADIVDRVRERIRIKLTDMGSPAAQLPLSATLAGVVADERRLGFSVAPLLKRLYIEIANGGWGPGYGLLGLTGGAEDDLGRTATADYALRRRSDPDDPFWHWPEGLLPICHWGCAIYSCIDSFKPSFPMIVFDPNGHEHEKEWTDSFIPEGIGFDAWIALWADGHDLWKRLYA